jgi:transcription elongation factor Elf1
MMFQPCPACKNEESVYSDHPEDPFKPVCSCEECGARFEIEPDFGVEDGEWTDFSTVGKQIA